MGVDKYKIYVDNFCENAVIIGIFLIEQPWWIIIGVWMAINLSTLIRCVYYLSTTYPHINGVWITKISYFTNVFDMVCG